MTDRPDFGPAVAAMSAVVRGVPDEAFRPAGAASLAPEWRERIPRRLAELAGSWRDPSAWEGQATAGTVTLPAAAAAMFALDEVVVHGWELARATGRPYEPDEATVRALIAFLREQPRSEQLFAPVVEPPPAAPAIDVLVGLTGRDPAWRA